MCVCALFLKFPARSIPRYFHDKKVGTSTKIEQYCCSLLGRLLMLSGSILLLVRVRGLF